MELKNTVKRVNRLTPLITSLQQKKALMMYFASVSNKTPHLDSMLMVCLFMLFLKTTPGIHYRKRCPAEPWVGHASALTSLLFRSPPKKPPSLPPQSVLAGHKASPCKRGSVLASSFPTHSTPQYIHFCESPELLVIADTFVLGAGSRAPQRGVSTPPGKGNKSLGKEEEEGRFCFA